MRREDMIARLELFRGEWDIAIIGGGATGIGAAIDAASRGYRTLLLEQADFGQGTSSRSTKLIHGGVRYLQQGNISFVLEALKERGILRQNAPHLVHNLPFIVPNYDWWEGPFYGIGLKLYDILAGKHGFGPSKMLSREETIQRLPTIETAGLRGGVIYYDGQFDDARLIINMAETAVEQGATVINYMKVTALIRANQMINGVIATDLETGITHQIKAKVVINATGVFSDTIRRMDDPDAPALIRPSQGIHIVLDQSFLPGNSAIMVPHTDDGRVLFAIPWRDRVIVGTTDTPVSEISIEPRPLPEEVTFLLSHTARYLTKDPSPQDVLSVFAGLRPLIGRADQENTAALSRDHTLIISRSGLVTIAGGKWTTYRKMAEDTIDQAEILARLDAQPCITKTLQIHGYHRHPEQFGELAVYGSDAPAIQDLLQEKPIYRRQLHPKLPIRYGEVIWAIRHEMARTVEDFLSRRTRALLLDARASREIAPAVAEIMAQHLGRTQDWVQSQIVQFQRLADNYILAI
ncbi:MAG: glycerol-3-phosphate dehydrogenase/oxidase [candidate division KSB1 bacterium]|nr:glycerol-3-phosphate dehydrogenase/oxidase [candidate division KSB1 bacterium]MDZ7333789.1 glycerol-3-phosphate dehydrogenase/oxidase [candidate division KSB1 bacterium]MDZ7357538.1 glycerol-3-phosphate dehydrogenase/oxidase [candidate division KSB1 bacterium]MDZ7400549.1 glycerol-3-phosphate dehydrogenase/oxidase [candidate division KSB1 bacterium]